MKLKNKGIYKYCIGFILGAIVFGGVGVLASTYILKSSEIEYKENKSVQEAVEELYTLVGSGGNAGSINALPIGDIVVDGYKITIPYTGSYDVIRCVYGTDTNYGNVGTISDNTCYFYGTDSTQKLYYRIVATTNDGKIYENSGSATTIDTVIADLVNLGDYIYLKPTSTSYTIESSSTGYSSSQTINPSELTLWRVISKNTDGTINIVSDKVSSTYVKFYGLTGYQQFEDTMSTISKQYINSDYVQSGRGIYVSMLCYSNSGGYSKYYTSSVIDSIKSVYGTLVAHKVGTSTAVDYWLSSTDLCSYEDTASSDDDTLFAYDEYNTFYVSTSGSIMDSALAKNVDGTLRYEWSNYHYLRPVLTIKSTAKIISGTGTSSNNYRLGI